MEEEVGLQKRHRSRNFTKYEKEVFYSVFSHYARLINDKRSTVDTVRDAWSRLLVDYNSQHNVYPRTRRQLQVLWRDEKFRAKKRGRKEQVEDASGGGDEDGAAGVTRSSMDETPEEEERQKANLLSPLLTIIKREHEAFTAGESAAAAAAHYHYLAPDIGGASPDTYHTRHSTPPLSRSSPSPDLCINSNPDDGPASPLPVETQLESCSSSPVAKLEQPEDSGASPQASSQYGGSEQARPPAPHWRLAQDAPNTVYNSHPEEIEREYHRVRLAQLRQEGAARLRVLEAELALQHQHRQMLQQQHELKMQILMVKLKRAREGSPLND